MDDRITAMDERLTTMEDKITTTDEKITMLTGDIARVHERFNDYL